MTVDLLAVIQAEAQADLMLKDAASQSAASLKQAIEERAKKFSDLKIPSTEVVQLPPLRPDLEKLTDAARRNKPAAIKMILEELYAS